MSKTTDETGKRLGFNYAPQIWQWTGPQVTTNRSGCRDFQGKRRMAAGYSLLQPLNSTHDGHFLEIRIYPLTTGTSTLKKLTSMNMAFLFYFTLFFLHSPVLYGFISFHMYMTLSCIIRHYLVSHVDDSQSPILYATHHLDVARAALPPSSELHAVVSWRRVCFSGWHLPRDLWALHSHSVQPTAKYTFKLYTSPTEKSTTTKKMSHTELTQ